MPLRTFMLLSWWCPLGQSKGHLPAREDIIMDRLIPILTHLSSRWTVPLRIPIRIYSMVTHFQLPPYEYHWTSRQARHIASVPTLQAPDFSLRISCAASTERLLEIIPYRTEETGGSCLPVAPTDFVWDSGRCPQTYNFVEVSGYNLETVCVDFLKH